MRNRILLRTLPLVLVALMLSSCGWTGIRLASAAPDLTLRDIEGNEVQLSSFKGRVIMLNFFATWCPPCKMEVPEFIELQKQYGRQGFTIIAVSLSRLDDTRRFAEIAGINYPVLMADSYATTVYGPIRSIPMTYMIDKDFKIAKKYIGSRSSETFEADILELMKK